MKKILSLMMAFVLVLSMSVTAFAADGQGSITITNATIGESYSVYKLFDATYNADAEGNSQELTARPTGTVTEQQHKDHAQTYQQPLPCQRQQLCKPLEGTPAKAQGSVNQGPCCFP